MRIAISVTMLTLLTLGGCQSTGDDADAVPASAIPPGMASSVTVPGGAPGDIADLVNATAASGQSQLLARGYKKTIQQGQTTFWWNPTTTICAQIVTSNGRYQTIGAAEMRYCGY